MVGEVFAGISAFNSMFNTAKALRELDDTVKRNAAVSDLWEQIIAAQQRYTAAIEQVNELKEELRRFETWDTEKSRYERKNVGYGAYAYVLKPEERGEEPPHWACTNCYEHSHIATLQYVFVPKRGSVWTCPSCKNTIEPGKSNAVWPT
jgi:rubrerythrin